LRRAPSLTRRLLTFLLFAQAIAFLVAWLLFITMAANGIVFGANYDFADVAYFHIRRLVEDSIVESGDGLRIEPTDALRERLFVNPQLQIAVSTLEPIAPLPGSSPALAERIRLLGDMVMYDARFRIMEREGPGGHGSFEVRQTKYGQLYLGASGLDYVSGDLLYALGSDWTFLATYFSAAFGASCFVLYLGLRSGLAPLRRVAEETAGIDLDSLRQGLSTRGVPSEIRPMIDAMNAALARVDASAARMRRYTANAAHELRTPLAILRARLQNPDEPTFRSDLERDASRLQAIVEQMLISARLGEGQATTDEIVDLGETVWTMVAAHMPLAIRCRRRIEFECADIADVAVRGNRRAIESVVANLIDNALRAEPTDGTVLVRVGAGPLVEVIDHGAGVDQADRETVFEPFWRKSDESPGAGLGLAIARELAERHGGRLWIDGTPGGGATFKLSLPPISENAPASAES
jgi:signal transduction histidine kinase